MDVKYVVPTHIVSQLTDGLQEGQTLNVANRSTNLGDDHISARLDGQRHYPVFNGIGDMGHRLNGAA